MRRPQLLLPEFVIVVGRYENDGQFWTVKSHAPL
jgi:hypothetical protein